MLDPREADSAAEHLLVAAAQRQPAAFDALYRRYVGPIYRYVRGRVGNQLDAEDLTAQVFYQALVALPRYRQTEHPFAAWLFRIAHNCVVSHLRRRPALRLDAVAEPNGAHPSQEDLVVRRELLREIGLAVQRLDVARQELLALYYGAGLHVPEIARVLGRSEASTYKLLERTVAALRREFKEREQGHGASRDA